MGFRLETYNKSRFVKKYGISMYVPRESAKISPARLLRSLFYKNPEIRTRQVKFLCKTTFTADHPNKPAGKRSRIGDAILLFDSPELADKLKPFDKDKKFFYNSGFSVTLKGGERGTPSINFAHALTSSVITSAAAEALRNAQAAS